MNIKFITSGKITSDVMSQVYNELRNTEGLKNKEYGVWVNAEMDSILIELKDFFTLQNTGDGATNTLSQIENRILDILNGAGIPVNRMMGDGPDII